jgi:tRNA wybutosine-synthesizing protein 2
MEHIDAKHNGKRSNERTKKRPPKETSNPLIDGVSRFLRSHAEGTSHYPVHDTAVLAALPKRYTIYKPLLLLPASVFTSPPAWAQIYTSLDGTERQRLYESIASSFRPLGVTHVALNAPIELTNSNTGIENRMRSPVGLVPLYGDFGPILASGKEPDSNDFKEAFWVQTVQNGGIFQCWAPLYTMFSRGNVTEKARVLGLGNRFDGLDASSLGGQDVGEISVVDLYAGIGYFSFSYLKRGVKRVWGWELNGWSVEGLRRGCLKNGWGCKVIPLDESGALRGVTYTAVVDELTDDDRIVLFHGDNRLAAEIMANIQPLLQKKYGGAWAPIRHVNLGLLPSSQPTWDSSLKLLDREYGGWTHVHENVDISEIDVKTRDIVAEYERLGSSLVGQVLNITCDHVEKVKTYAPGVMHCVYDIHVNTL